MTYTEHNDGKPYRIRRYEEPEDTNVAEPANGQAAVNSSPSTNFIEYAMVDDTGKIQSTDKNSKRKDEVHGER